MIQLFLETEKKISIVKMKAESIDVNWQLITVVKASEKKIAQTFQ